MIKFSGPLHKGTLVKRYKRFLADVTLENGDIVTAHCANTGSMKTCGSPGDTIWLLYNPSPKRKLDWSWEYTETENGYIGINTARPNRIVEDAIQTDRIAELSGYESIKREVKYGTNSKIDLLLESPDRAKCYVEIKNVTLQGQDCILFPDAKTDRGLRHLRELQLIKNEGCRAVMFFLVNRPDGSIFKPAADIHPEYAEELSQAHHAGVEILVYRAEHSLEGIQIGAPVPKQLTNYH